MKNRLFLLLPFALLLTGCWGSINKAYVASDRKKFESVSPYVLRKVDEDEKPTPILIECSKCKEVNKYQPKPKLTKIQADIKRKSMSSWEARIVRGEKEETKK